MDAKSKLGEILKEIIVSGLVAGGLDAVKNGLKKTGEKAGEKVAEKIISKMDERRGEMLAFIRGLVKRDPIASDNLLRRQRERQFCLPRSYGNKERYVPGDEDHFVTLLTKLYIALDEPHEKTIRTEIFVWLGSLSDEDFDATIEFLHHDVFIQWFKRSWGWIKQIGVKYQTADHEVAQQISNWAAAIRARYERR